MQHSPQPIIAGDYRGTPPVHLGVPTMSAWGTMIREMREQQGISQRQLAWKTRVNRSTLRRIETEETSGDIETIEKLLDYLGYELETYCKESVEERTRRQAQAAECPEERSRMAYKRLCVLG